MLSFNFQDLPEAYAEMLWKIKIMGIHEETRNGPVIAFPEPVGITLANPRRRVLLDPVRDANPFFHLMESVWMLAGQNDIGWLAQFNKRMAEYAEADGTQRGAYGFRWRFHFGYDQLQWAIEELKRDPTSRRVVLSMWDQAYDTIGAPVKAKDLPCNTHIYLRITKDKLNLSVCNRSNDMIWGCLGANAVHMTVLQEVLAHALARDVGSYTVMTNNLHMYTGMPKFQELMDSVPDIRAYPTQAIEFQDFREFLGECRAFVSEVYPTTCPWLMDTVVPVYNTWKTRQPGHADDIFSHDWRAACLEWLERRTLSSLTSTAPLPTTITGSTSSEEKTQQTSDGTSTSGSAGETPSTTP